jgi:hypothetical protein
MSNFLAQWNSRHRSFTGEEKLMRRYAFMARSCRYFPCWVGIGLLILFTGCASTKVQPMGVYSNIEPLPRPDRFLVYDFAVSSADVTLNRGLVARMHNLISTTPQTEEQLKVGRAVAAALSEELVEHIRALGLPAERASKPDAMTDGTLAIEGQFISIDEGNRLRRMVIGFGLGQSEVRTLVQVYIGIAGGQRIVQEFETSAQSSKAPGMGPMVGVGAAARGAAGVATGAVVGGGAHTLAESRQSAAADARRTADVLAKHLAQFFAAQGWIQADQAQYSIVPAKADQQGTMGFLSCAACKVQAMHS